MHSPAIEFWPPALRGASAAAARARAAFAAAAASGMPALIVADRGLQSETIARALHDRSHPERPFVVIDCSAGEGDVEQEIFPRLARAGTIYLKHILDLPSAVQRRLARVLRDREVVSGTRRVRVKARVLADVPPSLTFDAADGEIRSDLLRRLSQTRIDVPALRERPGDMREVAETLAVQLSGGAPRVFTQAALTVLAAPAWPGNLEELRDVLERVLRSAPRDAIRQEDVLAHLPIDGAFTRMAPHVSLKEARRQFEREYIASVLERHRWRMSDAARTLGIERANLYRKTRQLGIVRRSPRSSVAS